MSYTNRNFTWDFDALKRFYERYIVKWTNSAVSWTEAQKKQARANLGFGDGSIDSEPVAGSERMVTSGGVYDTAMLAKIVSEIRDGGVCDIDSSYFQEGYYNTGSADVFPANKTDSALWHCIILPIPKGVNYVIVTGKGGTNARLYSFQDKDNNILTKGGTTSLTTTQVSIPDGAVSICLNSSDSTYGVKFIGKATDFEFLEERQLYDEILEEGEELTPTDTANAYILYRTGELVSSQNFTVNTYTLTDEIKARVLYVSGYLGDGAVATLLAFYDSKYNFISCQYPASLAYNRSKIYTNVQVKAPSNAAYLRVQSRLSIGPISVKVATDTLRYVQKIDALVQADSALKGEIDDIGQLIDSIEGQLIDIVETAQEWVSGSAYSFVVGEAPVINTKSNYITVYVQDLKAGDKVSVRARSGASQATGAKLKNGVVVEILSDNPSSGAGANVAVREYDVDDTFDAIIFNNYTGYVSSQYFCNVAKKVSVIERLEDTVDEIVSKGVCGEFNMLCLGNSFTMDSVSYLPWLIKEAEPSLNLNIYMVIVGGMPLAQCLAYVSNGVSISRTASQPVYKYENHGGWDKIYTYNSADDTWTEPADGSTNAHKSYTLYKYENGADAWVSVSEPTAADVLGMKNWDLITIQQGGEYNYRDWSVYFKDYIHKIHAELQAKVGHNFKFGYIMSHASYTHDATELLQRFEGLAQNADLVVKNTPTEVILPYATALQNARTTYLNRFGIAGDLLMDSAHVNDGIGCLTCAYANALAILELIGSKKSILGSQIIPDASWITSHAVPGASSQILGLSAYNRFVAQQCAIMAKKNPLAISNMVTLGMVGDTEVELTLANCTSSNPVASANVGESYTTVITADTGYTISSVTVVMNGSDVTASAYNQSTGEVSITSVTGKIEINASATA